MEKSHGTVRAIYMVMDRRIGAMMARNNRPDTEKDIKDRLCRNAAAEQSHAETVAKFRQLTAENIKDALAFQEQRYQELLKG